MPDDDRVVIAGAGPVGLVSAALLVAQGFPVTVPEQEPDLTIDLRAGTFDPPSLEIMAGFGLTDRLLGTGIKVPHWQYRDLHDGVIAEFDLGMLRDDTPYPHRLHCEQHKMARLAYEMLKSEDLLQIAFSHRVVDITQDDDGVEVVSETPDGRVSHRGAYLSGGRRRQTSSSASSAMPIRQSVPSSNRRPQRVTPCGTVWASASSRSTGSALPGRRA